MEFFPQKSGVPVVVRMLSFIKTEVNGSERKWGSWYARRVAKRQSEVLNGYLH